MMFRGYSLIEEVQQVDLAGALKYLESAERMSSPTARVQTVRLAEDALNCAQRNLERALRSLENQLAEPVTEGHG